jgi:hypothetical protein
MSKTSVSHPHEPTVRPGEAPYPSVSGDWNRQSSNGGLLRWDRRPGRERTWVGPPGRDGRRRYEGGWVDGGDAYCCVYIYVHMDLESLVCFFFGWWMRKKGGRREKRWWWEEGKEGIAREFWMYEREGEGTIGRRRCKGNKGGNRLRKGGCICSKMGWLIKLITQHKNTQANITSKITQYTHTRTIHTHNTHT